MHWLESESAKGCKERKWHSWNGLDNGHMWFYFTTLIMKGSKGQNSIRPASRQSVLLSQPTGCNRQGSCRSLCSSCISRNLWGPCLIAQSCDFTPSPEKETAENRQPPEAFKGSNLLSLLQVSSGFRSPFIVKEKKNLSCKVVRERSSVRRVPALPAQGQCSMFDTPKIFLKIIFKRPGST